LTPPHKEQFPLSFKPPHDPERGFLPNMTPTAIPKIAKHKIKIPNNKSIDKLKINYLNPINKKTDRSSIFSIYICNLLQQILK